MDGREPFLRKGYVLPDEDDVYRIVINSFRDRRNKAIPAPRCFDLTKNDGNKLSVDREKNTPPQETIARVGASYKFNMKEYRDHRNRDDICDECWFSQKNRGYR